MGDLHAQILERIDHVHPDVVSTALRAVINLHRPVPCPGFPCVHLDAHPVCGACAVPTPCVHIRLIADQLGVDDPGEAHLEAGHPPTVVCVNDRSPHSLTSECPPGWRAWLDTTPWDEPDAAP